MKLRFLQCVTLLASTFVAYAQSTTANEGGKSGEFIPRMVDPSIDEPGQPFSYPSRPTDQLSVMYSTSGAEITPEGYLYTSFGELMFFIGIDRAPVNQRIRTLQDGYLPVFTYSITHDGLQYRFTLFAASLGPEQNGRDVLNFVRVEIANPGAEKRQGFLTTAWRYQGEQATPFPTGDDRFRRPETGKRPGDHEHPGEPFNPRSAYTVRENAYLRDGKAIYFFPASPRPQLTASYRDYYNRSEHDSAAIVVQPTTPMAAAEYQVVVPPGATRVLDFKIPLLPIPATDLSALHAVAQADFDDRRAQVTQFWNAKLSRGMQITTPEQKVNDTYRTSLVNTLAALNKVGNDTIQTINQFQYHAFYLRDSADFVRMYDTSGYPEIARAIVDFFPNRQQPDGNFLSQPGQYDGWGEALWTYGEHYRMTHDRAFAAAVYPRTQRAVAWLENAMAADPLHIVPATDVRDNEYIPGHLTGYNFLALDGLQAAVLMARDLGHSDDERRYSSLEQQLRANFMKQLDRATAQTGGYIPPALDGNMGGTDWGNLLSVTPEQQLSPFDPRVTATLRYTQARYEEGLTTYRQPGEGTYLHHYLTIKNTLTELIRGEQQQAIREFYAELLHTSSTNAGWEYSIRPWGDRDFSGNLAPHGWFAAEYRNLLRNMMVREEGSTLHLLSAVSPAWIGAGKAIHVHRAATYFGQYGFDLAMPSETEAALTLTPNFVAGFAPETIVLHLPWFLQLTSVSVDGKPVAVPNDGAIRLDPDSRSVTLRWKRNPLPSDLPANYDDAVARFKQEYQRRFDQLTRGTGDASEPASASK
ncbi:MAG: hypothetical protein WCE75_08640 [Terracidiphilus sp.]